MAWIKELASKTIYGKGYSEVYNILFEKLREMKLEVKQNDKENGLIVVHCLYKVVGLLFWKCFGEELLIEIKSNQKNETQVCVFMVPNFFRIKVGKGERLTDLTELLSEINKGGTVIRK